MSTCTVLPAPTAAVGAQPAGKQLGDIYVATWGIEQTNVQFFEVVHATPKTVTLREIAMARSREIHMTGVALPVTGSYIGDPFRRTVRYYNEQPSVSVDDRVFARAWDGQPQRFSTYA